MKCAEWTFPLIAAAATLCSACIGGDPYALVAKDCAYPVPNMGEHLSESADLVATTLTPACKAALEAVIPYDPESFATAPVGFKDKVTEAFQALVAYPIAQPKEATYFGIAPPEAGMISPAFAAILAERPNLNQSLFDDIINQVDVVKYAKNSGDSSDATYSEEFSLKPRQITIYRSFWDPLTDDESNYVSPFYRAQVLVHEARHGDGTSHVPCTTPGTQDWGYSCDNEMLGAYGSGALYLRFLIHGSGTCQGEGCKPLLPNYNVMMAGYHMCNIAKYRINKHLKALDDLLAEPGPVCKNITYSWIMQHEGLSEFPDASIPPPLPPVPPGPTPPKPRPNPVPLSLH
jgi:hypothetical protein